jgi:hypothetical protein
VNANPSNDLDVLLKRANLASAPQRVLREAECVFAAELASLVFDSFLQPSLPGARGSSSSFSSARQMVLRAEGFDIHLKIWGVTTGRRMAGQILARGEGSFVNGARLHLIRDGERFHSTAVDKFGEFEFEAVPEGLLSLQVDLPHLTVVGTLISQEPN